MLILLCAAFWPLAAGMLSLVFLVGALRVNVVFVMVFFTVSLGFLLLAGAFWEMGLNDMDLFTKLCQVSQSMQPFNPTLLTHIVAGHWRVLVRDINPWMVLALCTNHGRRRIYVAVACWRSQRLLGEEGDESKGKKRGIILRPKQGRGKI